MGNTVVSFLYLFIFCFGSYLAYNKDKIKNIHVIINLVMINKKKSGGTDVGFFVFFLFFFLFIFFFFIIFFFCLRIRFGGITVLVAAHNNLWQKPDSDGTVSHVDVCKKKNFMALQW